MKNKKGIKTLYLLDEYKACFKTFKWSLKTLLFKKQITL